MLNAIGTALAFLLVGVVAVMTQAVAQTTFEGKVVYHVKSKEMETDMTFFSKQPKVRMETSAQGNEVQMIMDGSTKKMLIIMPQQQMYMERTIDVPMPADKAGNAPTKGKPGESAMKAQRTGKTKTILGYECEQWVDKEKEGETELWLTKGLGSFSAFSAFGGGGAPGMGKRMGGGVPPGLAGLATGELFPMQVFSRSASGDLKASMEATAIEKKTLDAALFQPPSGFNKIEMPAGMPNR